jgi:hypothetical protein
MDQQQQVSQPQSSNWKKIALIIFLVFIAVAGIIIGILYGTGVLPGKSSNTTSDEITKNSGLFLVSLVTDGDFGLIVPILISQKQSDNTGIAGTWASVGAKMGITPVFDEKTNTYKLNILNNMMKYVQTISFVANGSLDVIPSAAETNAKMYTYLLMGSAEGTDLCLYTIGKGVCSDISKYQVIEETPLGYDYLKNLAFESINRQGFCTPNNKPSGCIPGIPSVII